MGHTDLLGVCQNCNLLKSKIISILFSNVKIKKSLQNAASGFNETKVGHTTSQVSSF